MKRRRFNRCISSIASLLCATCRQLTIITIIGIQSVNEKELFAHFFLLNFSLQVFLSCSSGQCSKMAAKYLNQMFLNKRFRENENESFFFSCFILHPGTVQPNSRNLAYKETLVVYVRDIWNSGWIFKGILTYILKIGFDCSFRLNHLN